MRFPARPTTHDHIKGGPFLIPDIVWRPPRKDDERGVYDLFRTCSYCGSVHPEDLLKQIQGGATLHRTDFKYGWPHKFYVKGVPNGFQEDRLVVTGKSFKDGVTKSIMGSPPVHSFVKWYNTHLLDEGFDSEARDKLVDALYEATDIGFHVSENGLKYSLGKKYEEHG